MLETYLYGPDYAFLQIRTITSLCVARQFIAYANSRASRVPPALTWSPSNKLLSYTQGSDRFHWSMSIIGASAKQKSMMGGGVCRARQSRCPYYMRPPRVPGGLSRCTNHPSYRFTLPVPLSHAPSMP